jgi:3,4-dihydroxy 2-butanone 4-phosphate synthase / GTP cyclohydrolase II
MTEYCITKSAEAKLPTEFGDFRIVVFKDDCNGKEHSAIIKGDIAQKSNVPCRIHSKCLTGDTFGSLKCDCREQMIFSLKYIEKIGTGVLIYLDQEGRDIGLVNKIKAYKLQEEGYDTAEANKKLGFKEDERSFKVAVDILKILGVKSVSLLTNNPDKISDLEKNGIKVEKRIPIETRPTKHNEFYLKTKKEKLGHLLNI